MHIDLSDLRNKDIFLDEDFKIDVKNYKINMIDDLKNLHVSGFIRLNSADIIEFDLKINGVMLLKDSITLDLVEYPFTSLLNEEYELNDPYFQEYIEKDQNTLDILEILWENIVLEVPMRFTKAKDAVIKGNGWSLGNIENKDEEIDPRLAKLTELIEEKEEENHGSSF